MLVAQPVRECHSFVNPWTVVWIQLRLTSNLPVLTTLFKPITVIRLKDALERSLSEELRSGSMELLGML